MNEPIISPWVFYWVETIGQIRDVANFAMSITAVISAIVLFETLMVKKEEREKYISKETLGRVIKWLIITGVISTVGYMFIPAKETVYKMLAASYITQENIENVGESIDKIADKLVEKINQVKK